MKRLISILLVVMMLVIALASCMGKTPASTTAATTTTPTTTPPTTTTKPSVDVDDVVNPKWETLATDVKGMAADLRSLKFELSDVISGTYDAKNEEYMVGPDSLEGASAIQRLIYERNKEACDTLGITIEYTKNNDNWGFAYPNIVTTCTSTEIPNAPDMYVNMMYDMVGAALGSSFRDLLSIKDSYFDFTEEGWFYDIMSDMSFSRERVYLMASDYFVDIIRNMMVLPFNLSMLDSSVQNQELVDVLAGGQYQNGDYLSDYLFDLVRDGKWTYDKLTAICEKISQEGNGGVSGDSEDDILGLYLDCSGGTMASGLLYSTNVVGLSDTKDANGAVTKIVYPATGDELHKVFKKVDTLMKASGTLAALGAGTESVEINGNIDRKFAQGTLFSNGPTLLGDFENDSYQKDMQDIFSVVPLPLLEEGSVDDHNTPIHNCAMVGGINIQSQKYLAVSAFVQYSTEHPKTQEIRLEYLEIAMKYEMFEYNPGTDEMLTIIYNNIKSCREMIVDNIVAQQGDYGWEKQVRWHGFLLGNGFENADNFLSEYESLRSSKQGDVDELLAKWYQLPKATTAQ